MARVPRARVTAPACSCLPSPVALLGVSLSVAVPAEGNEVLRSVNAAAGTMLLVVYLEMLPRAALLAAPVVAGQYLAAYLYIWFFYI